MVRENKDYEEAKKHFRNDNKVLIKPWDENFKHLKVVITGVSKTPYYKGKFEFEIKFPDNYPFRSPFVSCKTKIWHPNIDLNKPSNSQNVCLAMICIDVIAKDGAQATASKWTPKNSLIDLIEALKKMIHCKKPYFSPKCPLGIDKMGLNSEAGKQYQKTPEKFFKKAKEWTEKYAM